GVCVCAGVGGLAGGSPRAGAERPQPTAEPADHRVGHHQKQHAGSLEPVSVRAHQAPAHHPAGGDGGLAPRGPGPGAPGPWAAGLGTVGLWPPGYWAAARVCMRGLGETDTSGCRRGTPKRRGKARRSMDASAPLQPQGPKPAGASSLAQLEAIRQLGLATAPSRPESAFHVLSIIGQIEGHLMLPAKNKTTKYEHVIPQLV